MSAPESGGTATPGCEACPICSVHTWGADEENCVTCGTTWSDAGSTCSATPPAVLDGLAAGIEEHVERDLELRSRLYGWLGDRTSSPVGDEWDHGALRILVNDLVGLIRSTEAGQ